MRIQCIRMWFLRDRNCNSNKSEAGETELVHQNGNREVPRWLLFLPTPLAPSCLEPSITSSVQSNAKSLSSPLWVALPLHGCCFHSCFHVLLFRGCCRLPAGLCLQSPHITLKRRVILLEENQIWIFGSIARCSLGSNLNSVACLPGPSGMGLPASPASHLCHIQVWCVLTYWNREGKILALHLHAFSFFSPCCSACPSTASGNFLLHHNTFSDALNN